MATVRVRSTPKTHLKGDRYISKDLRKKVKRRTYQLITVSVLLFLSVIANILIYKQL